MTAYVIAGVRVTGSAEEMAVYRERVEATLEPYGGRYLVRTSDVEQLDGRWPADSVVVVEFPDLQSARAWNNSAEYAPLAALRESNSDSIRMIVDGYVPT
ncbi:DUF1330 domain-containing protein [Pseudonocardia acaciae]|uniref:DUF1330 domain-containing protein n=1 Tax=Pseudonocardia acaciae TaxID=551276 RepID=UPI00048DEA4B|nr:DUF1330 domain-containing protein [Pseudonocardia acaciae]